MGGFYTVLEEGGGTAVCKARGLFRKQNVTPVVGDLVEFTPGASGAAGERSGYLMRILPRKNELIRPAVSNIDRLFIVVAASRPCPDLLLVDKMLILAEKYGVEPLLVINKCDEAEPAAISAIAAQYAPAGYGVHCVSAASGMGLPALAEKLRGAVICLAGQSAVGKSSLLNALVPGISLAVGGLSEKTERGRHTTRHTELIPLENGGAVLDTPGFSLLDALYLEPEEIRMLYPELRGAEENCRFSKCLHITEPGCFVKKELIISEKTPFPPEKGIHRERYERYVRLVHEAKEQRRHRYD